MFITQIALFEYCECCNNEINKNTSILKYMVSYNILYILLLLLMKIETIYV